MFDPNKKYNSAQELYSAASQIKNLIVSYNNYKINLIEQVPNCDSNSIRARSLKQTIDEVSKIIDTLKHDQMLLGKKL